MRFWGYIAFLLWMSIFPPSYLVAQEQDELHLPEIAPPSGLQGGVGILRFVLAFLLVVAILWVLFVVLRKLIGQGVRMSSSKYMRIIDTLYVRSNLSFYLLEIGERIIVVAQSGNSVREIAELSKDDLVENPTPGFSNYLDHLFRRKPHDDLTE